MEPHPNTPDNFNSYQTAAVELFDAVDDLFTLRKVPSMYEKIADRHSKIELSEAERTAIEPLLATYAIDAPRYASIAINGYNPFTESTNIDHGAMEITMHHDAHDGKAVKTTYGVWLDRRYSPPLKAFKDVDIADFRLMNDADIGSDEYRALRYMLRVLKDLT